MGSGVHLHVSNDTGRVKELGEEYVHLSPPRTARSSPEMQSLKVSQVVLESLCLYRAVILMELGSLLSLPACS